MNRKNYFKQVLKYSLALALLIIALFLFVNSLNSKQVTFISPFVPIEGQVTEIPAMSPTPTEIPLPPPPLSYEIPLRTHMFQTFNNCGPASLSMLLSYFDLEISQKELGDKLRPYQVPGGNNDDKSVTLEELASVGVEQGLIAYHRPNGDMDKLKGFISEGLPVLVRTWTKPGEDIGHYRVVRGYDDSVSEIIQDDSLQDKNLRFSYTYFNEIWQAFNYEYVVLVPPEKAAVVEKILGKDSDPRIAWENAVNSSTRVLSENPEDVYARFNLSVALYHTGNFRRSAEEFEVIENKLPFRMLWYQIEPVLSYFELGQYDRVFQLTDKILNNHNRAFTELYVLRGEIMKMKNDPDGARIEFEKAVYYNRNQKAAINALESISR